MSGIIKAAPSILSGDFASMGETVQRVNEWGADYVHVDVMDGMFVKNITFGMPMVKAIKKYSRIPLDVHLMIVKPENYVEEFVSCGADIVSFHPNATEDVGGTIDRIRALNAGAGLAINPDIPVSAVAPYIDRLDMVMIMGVYAGFGGQKYIKEVDKKILETAELIARSGRAVELEVDGGVTEENAREIAALGANVLVGGSSVFKSSDPARTIRVLKGLEGR